MKTKFIEASNGGNWGKFALLRFDEEWSVPSQISEGSFSLLRNLGWTSEHLWVLDLQTGEGAFFKPGGLAGADLRKHQIWVCPLYESFLTWLYRQDLADLDRLPDLVTLDAPFDMAGYRRPGPGPAAQEPSKSRDSA